MTELRYQRTAEQVVEEIEMMSSASPDRWPRYPLLPVKKLKDEPGALPLMGCLVAGRGAIVYDLNPFAPVPADLSRVATWATYPGIVDMVANGWVVD